MDLEGSGLSRHDLTDGTHGLCMVFNRGCVFFLFFLCTIFSSSFSFQEEKVVGYPINPMRK